METKQPEWKCVAQLGDAHPLEYGGYWVFVDQTGVYAPEAEWLEVPDECGPVAHRFTLDPCTYINGVLSANKFHPDKPAWFADKLLSMAEFVGCSTLDLITDFCSNEPERRAHAWRIVGEYFGFVELDSYPLIMTRAEVEERYSDPKYQVHE